ncbi:hypothetical protein CONLIGDRAFT_681607 [Coniochaeta ligniaria NRRL 30616]|uniref:Uncharacterized protein n=1 Tax=Coniochaeta ligniaria NRRL 30616 TaxID=1408157 RepID=A0A1J7IMG3_9PEZI|nr:hypothetical protein CONLIGDRAFT_681607 [Coniochaeta ligniaria NRRL 30616]
MGLSLLSWFEDRVKDENLYLLLFRRRYGAKHQRGRAERTELISGTRLLAEAEKLVSLSIPQTYMAAAVDKGEEQVLEGDRRGSMHIRDSMGKILIHEPRYLGFKLPGLGAEVMKAVLLASSLFWALKMIAMQGLGNPNSHSGCFFVQAHTERPVAARGQMQSRDGELDHLSTPHEQSEGNPEHVSDPDRRRTCVLTVR